MLRTDICGDQTESEKWRRVQKPRLLDYAGHPQGESTGVSAYCRPLARTAAYALECA